MKSRCFYKSTTISKMNSFVVIFMNFLPYIWNHTVGGRAFCKKSYFCRGPRSGCFQRHTQNTAKILR